MNEVKVKKEELLKRITENREKHHAAVVEAQSGYRKAVIEELDRMLKDAREGLKLRTHVTLVIPVDHTKEYDNVIDMLKMSTDEIIVLNSEAFKNYVRDEWQWDANFAASNLRYAGTEVTKKYLSDKGA